MPPADLAACSRLIGKPSNRLYERYFMRRLLAAVAERHRLFPDLTPVDLPERLSLYQFDNLYTAPQCGFASTEEGNTISIDDQRRKLELVVETATSIWGGV